MLTFQNTGLFITTLFSGLVAGLLYSYSCSVNIGLKALPDAEYLKAMQSINVAIQNPYFFISFMGLLIVFPVTIWKMYSLQSTASFYLLLAAGILYFIGVFGVTVTGNIPLNNLLAKFSISSASLNDVTAMRVTFESAWNKFHFIRTACAMVSFALALLSILKLKSSAL